MIVIALAVIAGIAYWVVAFQKSDGEGIFPQDTREYVRMDRFPDSTTGDRSQIEQLLMEAFIAGELIEVGRFAVPGTSDQEIVVATPSLSGRAEEVECGIHGHSLCGLYLVEAARPPRLLLWGSRMSGFLGIEGFSDSEHAIISTAWSLYNFTSIERNILNIATGELRPKLLIEIDRDDTFAEIRASGFGDVVTLSVFGKRSGMNLVPEMIIVRNQDGEMTDSISANRLNAFTLATEESEARIEPIAIEPVDIDSDELLIPLALYDKPYVLDLQKGTLRSIDAVSR